MKIGIVGGNGGMGEGFALRWCAKHQIVIGSRDKNKAAEVASNYMKIAQDFYKDKIKGGGGGGGRIGEGNISGDNNFDLGKDLDILILSIPYESINDTCSKLSNRKSTRLNSSHLVISYAVF